MWYRISVIRGSVLFFLSSLRASWEGVVENALEEIEDEDLVMHLLEERVRERSAERRDGWGWRREGILEVDWRFRFRWECCESGC